MPNIVKQLTETFRRQQVQSTLPSEDNGVENKCMIEAFEWYSYADGQHWKRIKQALPFIKELGVDKIWIPPACKAGFPGSNGYDIYDLYDLGEFDQKGSIATKWGLKEDLMDLSHAAESQAMSLVFDAVLNHKGNADYTQHVRAVRVDDNDRRRPVEKPLDIEAWLGFNYDGRGGKHSPMKYTAEHFNGTNYDQATNSHGIYKLSGKEWADDVDKGKGNYDFLLCNNLDLAQDDVRKDLHEWALWVASELELGGFRFDAAKHMSQSFMKDYVQMIRRSLGRDYLLVGEYCSYDDTKSLLSYIRNMDGMMSLFDFPLLRNLTGISRHREADLRFILSNTLAEQAPAHAVTFVTNHDTQNRQDVDEPRVEEDFLPVAYAVILLHVNCVYPCLFWGDLFGVNGPHGFRSARFAKTITRLAMVRRLYAYGKQHDYFNDRTCVGFSRVGVTAHSNGAGVAVVINNSDRVQNKRMNVGRQHCGERWTEVLEGNMKEVVIDSAGWATFTAPGARNSGVVTVWTNVAAAGRERLTLLK